MGDLGEDTAAQGSKGSYTAHVSQDWEIWGPCGGYVASLALRAAGNEMGRLRPLSINAHYLSVAQFAPVDIDVLVTRTTKFATAAQVTMKQGDRNILTAMVWGGDEMDGLDHQTGNTPPEPGYESLTDVADLLPPDTPQNQRFWMNLNERPTEWIEQADWHKRAPGEPKDANWYRFRPTPVFADPWVDACRQVILLDVCSWGSAVAAHRFPMDWYAPTIEFSARFVRDASAHPWLLSRAMSPAAQRGLVACTGEIWAGDNVLVATGGSTLMCLPANRRPDQ